MAIFRDQVKTATFAPTSLVEETTPRQITPDDHGKCFYILGETGGTFDLPAWSDVRPGFMVQFVRNQVVAGSLVQYPLNAGIPYYFGIRPTQADSLMLFGRYETAVLGSGVELKTTDTDQFTTVYRMNEANRWFVEWNHSATVVWSSTTGIAKAAVIEGGTLWQSFSAIPDCTFFVCGENGEVDPGGRILGYFDGFGNFVSGPDGVSGGPLLPFYVSFYNNGLPAVVGDGSLGVTIWVTRDADANWPLIREFSGDYGPLSAFVADGGLIGTGETLDLYVGNSGQDFGGYDEWTAARLFGFNFYLRQAPGELTPRTWAQAFALGPY